MTKTNLSEKFVIAIYVALNFWIYNVYAQGDCTPEGSDIPIIAIEIIPGVMLESPYEIDMSNTIDYMSHTETPTTVGNYFEIGFNNNKLLIMTNPSFLNYEKEQNAITVETVITLECSSGSSEKNKLYLTIQFQAVNHFAPEFSENYYEILIPLPLPSDVNIFSFISQRISAIDYDLKYNQITFTSDMITPFLVSTSSTTGTMGKEFFAEILTKEKILNLRDGIEFKITATDSGETEQLSSTVDVKLTAEFDDAFIEVPIFTQSLYTGTLDFTKTPTLNIEISLLDDTFSSTIVFATDLSDGEYFQLNRNGLDNAIQITLKEGVSQEDLTGITQLAFVVTATRTDGIRGNAAVLVNVIPKKSLVFDNVLYTGTIKSDMTVVHDLIKLTEDTHQSDVQFIIQDDPLGWFEIVSTPNVNEMKVKLISDLTDLEDKSIVSLTVLARSSGSTALDGEAHVILGIERAEVITPTFEKSFYEGVISNLEITDLEPLKFKTGTNIGNIIYEVVEHNDLFEAVETADGVQIIKKNLAESDIIDVTTLQFTLTATNEKGIVGSTVVILTIEREELIMPVFKQKLYTGNLKRPFSPVTFELEEILIDTHEGVIEFDLTGDDIHLIKIETETANGVKLGLIDGVTIDTDRTVLTVIVTAKLTDAIIGSTVVLIHVEEAPVIQPAFEKPFYYGSLSELNALTMIDSIVKLKDETFFDTITFEKIGDDAKYFIVSQVATDNNVEIVVDPGADLDELADRTTVSFSIQATLNENGYTLIGTTTVVIELPTNVLPPEIVPTFEHHLYAGSLTTDLQIRLDSLKITTDTFTAGMEYELFDFDSDLFGFVVSTTEIGTIDIFTNQITEEILKTKQLFKFNVRAENADHVVGITAVVIEIPRELVSEVIIPQFEQPLYNGVLQRDGVLILDTIIKITESTYSSNLEFSIKDDSGLFEVINQRESNIVEISMKPYDETDLQGKNVLNFAVIGKLTDDIIVTTSVLIDITPIVTLTEPKFIEALYIGTLNSAMAFSIGYPEITADSYSDDITYEKSGEDSDLFTIIKAAERVIIEPIVPITEENIRYKTNLRFTLTAIKSNRLFGSTAIVIEIPAIIVSEVLPQFESPFYKGSLSTEFSLSLSTINLQQATYTTDIRFLVEDNMFEIDELNSLDHIVTIKKSSAFNEALFKDQKFYSFAVVARLGSLIEGTTTVILDIESPNEILVPQFEQSLYEGVLSASYIPSIVQTIKLTANSFAPDVVFTLDSEFDSSLFKLEHVTGENLVNIVSNGLNEGNTNMRTSFKFVISATKSTNLIGSTAIVITNPNAVLENIIVPKFDKLIYAGSISPELTFAMEDIIKITEATHSSSIEYDVIGGNGLFKVTALNGNIITIGLDRDIEQSDINDKKVLSFTLVASLPDLVQGTATIIIDITSPNAIIPPEFEKSVYIGTLSDTFRLEIVDLKLTVDSYSDDIVFEKVDDFDSNLFSITRNSNNVVITSNGITDDDILLKPVLKFVIRATKSNGLVGTTAVIIHIPSITVDDFIIPIFEKPIYTGDLSTDFNLDFTELIRVTSITYSTAIQFTLEEGNSDLFEITNEIGNEFGIILSRPLTASDIINQRVLSFMVVARLGTFIHGTSTVIIDIETDSTVEFPVFEESLYIGTLDDAYALQVGDIKLAGTSYSTDVDFELVNEFDSNYFEIDLPNTIGNNVKVVSKGITEDILNTKTLFKFVISASKTNGFIGTTVVMVNVIIPVFTQSIYHGSLSNVFELVSDIYVEIIDETFTTGITFTLKDGDYDLFEIREVYQKRATIVLRNSLDESDVQGRDELSFVVEAMSNEGFSGTATVIIDIYNPCVSMPPVFVQTLYVGSLNTDLELNPISIMLTGESYSDDVIFELVPAFDSVLFTISPTSGNNVEISANGISAEEIESKNVLKIVISATKSNNLVDYTVLIIEIPGTVPDNIIIPVFENSIYTDTLPPAMDQLSILVKLKTETITPGITFHISDGDSGLFEITDQDDGHANIELSRPLDESTVQGKRVLIFTVEALMLATGFKGTSTVIIDIPDPSAILTPEFVQSLYTGSLDTNYNLILNDQITLTSTSYSVGVAFDLVDAFDSDLFSITYADNSVTILSNGITESDLMSKTILKFMIRATKSNNAVGTTVVIVNIPVVDILIPEFDALIYSGRLSDLLELNDDIDIKVNDDSFTPGTEFNLIGDDYDLFTIAGLNGNEFKVILKRQLTQADILNKDLLLFTVEATVNDEIRTTSTVIIYLPDTGEFLSPTFEETLYVGYWDEVGGLTLVDLVIKADTNSNDVSVAILNQFDYNFFEITQVTGNNVKLNVRSITEEVISSKSVLKVVIRATNAITNLVGATVVVVELRGTPSTTLIIPQFEQPLYLVLLTTELKIDDMEPIKIDSTTYSTDIIIGWDGIDKNLFQYVRTGNQIKIETIRDLTENDLVDKQVLSLIVSATLPTGEGSSTVVLFEIPFESCQIPNEDTRPVFDQPNRYVTIEPEKIGSILVVEAAVPTDPSIEISYGLQIDDSGLASKIDMNRVTGVLSLTDRVAPGVYNFIITGTNQVHNTVGYAYIKLTVTSVVICSGDSTVSHSLLVKYLEEGTTYDAIIDTTIDDPDCKYNILTVTPNSLASLFEIQGNLLTSKAFDRESDVFADMAIPQIRLLLQIDCITSAQTLNGKYMSMAYNRTRATRSTKDVLDDNYYVYTSDILRDAKTTIISIVIKDKNDNSPVFENPTGDILLGYPESKLAEKLLPPHLIKVYATDKDDGINAKIRYTIVPNPHFGVHAETGVVYPLRNSMDDALQYDLEVNAIDEDGTGNATPLKIKVKRLEEKNFIIISIENEILDNLDTILNKIEAEVNIRVNVLNAVIVSSTMEDTETELRSKTAATPFIDGEQTVLRIIGYAFNVNGDPIENAELESTLSEITTVASFSTQNLIEIIGNCDVDPEPCTPTDYDDDTGCDECDYIGFIVGLIILALLLLLACIAIFLMWWRWIRPYRYVKRDSTTNEQLKNDFNDTGYTEPVVAPIATTTTNAGMFGKSNLEFQNESAPTVAGSQSSPTSLAKSLQSVLDMDNRKTSIMLDQDNMSGSSETDDSTAPPSRERKKSIKFNETVERIDILDNAAVDKEDTIF